MRAFILYSGHEAGSLAAAQALRDRLAAAGCHIGGIWDAFGDEDGACLKRILGPRAFPAVFPVEDHWQGEFALRPNAVEGMAAQRISEEDEIARGVRVDRWGEAVNQARAEAVASIMAEIRAARDLPGLRQKLGL